MRQVLFLTCVLTSLLVTVYGENYQIVNDGPIHEAFIVREAGYLLAEAIPTSPPAKITEIVPRQTDPSAIWVPGYWAWSRSQELFFWVSGVWRRPPPGFHWVPGYWKNYPLGWVWIGGFWSNVEVEQLAYINIPPPDPIDERVTTPPGKSDKHVWIPGYWEYDLSQQQYVWYAGRWDLLDPHWVFCPANYVWRETGYVFVPAFWDWPIEERGVVFAAIIVDSNAVETIAYEPKNQLEPLFVMEHFFSRWPDFACLFQHHFLSHYDTWLAWGASPPWWNWSSWWALPHTAQWGLWWWWSHPGYPNPSWINEGLAKLIPPPRSFVVLLMRKVKAPPFVTSRGVVGEKEMFDTLTRLSGNQLPIWPTESQLLDHIQLEANPHAPQKPYLEPRGTAQPAHIPEKPFLGPHKLSLKAEPKRLTLPARPVVIEKGGGPAKESIETKPASPPRSAKHKVLNPEVKRKPAPPSPPQQYYRPGPSAPSYQYYPGQGQYPGYRPGYGQYPGYSPGYGQYPMRRRPPEPLRRQGYSFDHRVPQHNMQTEHHNVFMTHPWPQINPEGPQVYTRPGYIFPPTKDWIGAPSMTNPGS